MRQPDHQPAMRIPIIAPAVSIGAVKAKSQAARLRGDRICDQRIARGGANALPYPVSQRTPPINSQLLAI